MVANLTPPLIDIVSTIAIGRLGDAARRRGDLVGDFVCSGCSRCCA